MGNREKEKDKVTTKHDENFKRTTKEVTKKKKETLYLAKAAEIEKDTK